jgi:MFS transporter, DHA1 family, inner membrane transport protein
MSRLTATEVRRALVAVVIARLALNGGIRVVYPFLPEIARGLGVSLAAVAALVGLRSFLGLSAPLVARLTETYGRRTLMLAAGAIATAGCLVTAGAPGLAAAAVGFALIGLGKPTFDVPMQSWFGERVPYARRGRVLGLTELTWSLSLLATVPVSGVLITVYGWRAPFLLVAVMGVVGILAVARLIPADRPATRVRRPLRLTRERVLILAVVVLFSLAAELLFVVYGAWLEDDLGLTVAAIGVFTLLVVGAEFAGEGAVAAVADRIGLRRMIFAGLAGTMVAYTVLGWVGSSLVAAVAVVVCWFVAFEVTIVATIPFVSELAVESRDRLLSLMVALVAGGRMLGAFGAEPLYRLWGIRGNGLAAAACVTVAAALLTRVRTPSAAHSG